MRHRTHQTAGWGQEVPALTNADLVRLCGGEAVLNKLARKSGLHVSQPSTDGKQKKANKHKR